MNDHSHGVIVSGQFHYPEQPKQPENSYESQIHRNQQRQIKRQNCHQIYETIKGKKDFEKGTNQAAFLVKQIGREQSQYILNRKHDHRPFFELIEGVSIFQPEWLERFQNHTENAQYDQGHDKNIKKFTVVVAGFGLNNVEYFLSDVHLMVG